MHSSLYAGQVRHRRFSPREHQFSYRLYMLYLDLDELPTLFQRFWLWSLEKRNIATFRRGDHLRPHTQDLKTAVYDLIEERSGKRPQGPVRLLTNLAYFGFRFNPVSFYYCFDASGEQLEYIVAEVNNTPWGEQFCYVMDAVNDQNREQSQTRHDTQTQRHLAQKQFHVSPFMTMDINYDWRLSKPGEQLNVHMENHHSGEKLFDATMRLNRQTISRSSLARILVSHPLQSFKVVGAIYFEALRLWLKRVPFIDHPGTSNSHDTASTQHNATLNNPKPKAFMHHEEVKTS